MKKISIAFLLVLCVVYECTSQVDLQFVKHLSVNKLKEEHLHYINNSTISPDSADYLRSKFYLQYGNDSLFFKHLASSEKFSMTDSLLVAYATVSFLKKSNQSTDKWIDFVLHSAPDSGIIKGFLTQLHDPEFKNRQYELYALRDDLNSYRKALKKKPLLAASLSAIIPGAGKAYIGRKRSFGITLAAHILSGFQTYESIKKLGVKNPVSIFNIGMFGLMYGSNIYGSYIETKKIKREKYHQLLNHASEYFNMELGSALYN